MSHKDRYYHVVLNTAPQSLFDSEGLLNKSQYSINSDKTYICFWDLNSSLSNVWDAFKVIEGLTHKEMKALAGSVDWHGSESIY